MDANPYTYKIATTQAADQVEETEEQDLEGAADEEQNPPPPPFQ